MKRLLAVVIASVMAVSGPMTVSAQEIIQISGGGVEAESIEAEQTEEEQTQGMAPQEEAGIKMELPDGFVVSALEGKEALQSRYRVSYHLSSAQMADKRELFKVLDGFADAAPGKDYVENQIVAEAEDEAEAEEIADAFEGELINWQSGVAVIDTEVSTLTAVTMAADETFQLPAVYPNFWYSTDDVMRESSDPADSFSAAEFQEKVREAQKQGDEMLKELDTEEVKLPDQELLAVPDEALTGSGTADVNDPYVVLQWFHKMIDTFNAWKVTKGAGVTVAVIDSGIDYYHVEFQGRVRAAYCITTGLLKNDAYDNVGHGTHVAGIIGAAADNGYGGVGVAPEVDILSLKALEEYGNTGQAVGTTADITACMNYAVEQSADIINMSLGGPSAGSAEDLLYQRAVNTAVENGITVIVAAGNESMDISKKDNRVVPACLNGVISVASLDYLGDLSFFSNYGRVDVAAPGGTLITNGDWHDILSAVPGDGYQYKAGTSMACPVVSGVAALVIASGTARGANAVADVLKKSCINIGNKKNFGAGRVNAAAAVNAVSIYAKDDNFSVVSGKSLKLTAKTGLTPVKAEWVLSDSSAGTLSQSGVFKAAKNIAVPVKVDVTAICGSSRDTVTITIYPTAGKLTSGSPKTMSLSFGQTAKFSVMSEGGVPYTFRSSNNRVALVDEAGNIQAQSNGKATITAKTAGGKKISMRVTVKDTPFKIDRIVAVNSRDRDAADMFSKSFLAQEKTTYPMTAGKSMKFKVVSSWPYNTSSNKKVQWLCTYGGKIKNGNFKMDKHIAQATLVRITAVPVKGTGGGKDIYAAGFVPIEGFSFISAGQTTSSISVEVPRGYIAYVPYSVRYKEGQNTRAMNPYPYVESSDSSIATGYYDDNASVYRIAVVGRRTGTCRLTLISMDGAYRKSTIDVTVY